MRSIIPMQSPPNVPPLEVLRKRRAPRREYRTHSLVHLEDITENERDAARIWPFTIWGVQRLTEPAYLDSFYKTIDDEYGAFAALSFPRQQKIDIAERVAASIRTIAAFSAWYEVVWNFISLSFALSIILGALAAAGAFIWFFPQMRSNGLALALGIVIPLVVILLVTRLAALLPRRWPLDALTLLVSAAAFATIAQHFASSYYADVWKFGVVAAAIGAGTLSAILFLGVVIGQAAYQRITWCKISQYPEEEIIESIAFLLTSIDDGQSWRIPEERARASVTLEWIARRFQENLARRYLSGNSSVDTTISTAAAERGEAFRSKKMGTAFPGAGTIDVMRAFLWDALLKTSSNRWDALQCVPVPAAAPPRRRALTVVGTAAAILVPLLVAGALLFAFQHDAASADIRRNAAITLGSWSLLSLLAILNPKQFEQQMTAAKTLGDLVTRKAS